VSAAVFLTIWHFSACRTLPVKFSELERVALTVPYTDQSSPGGAMLQAVSHNFNYLNQFITYISLKGVMLTEPSQIRHIDLLGAILAVLWIYRVGRLCVNIPAGILAAVMLACCPPEIWGRFALGSFIILLNWERFLYAVQQNTFFAWAVWCAVTLLLFFNRIFAEPIVLQTWFVSLLAVLLFRRWFPVTTDIEETVDHTHTGRHHHKTISLLKWDSTLLPFFLTLFSAWVVIFFMSIVGAIFFLQLTLSDTTFLMIFIISLVVMPAVGALLLTFPMFNSSWYILKNWFKEIIQRIVCHRQRNMFAQIHSRELLNACFAYSAAIILFIPFLFYIHKNVNIFIDYWEVSRWYSFTAALSSPLVWLAVLFPLVGILATGAGTVAGLLPRTRFVGVCCLFLLSVLYVFQQRYAGFSAPFYVLCCAASFVTPVELIILVIQRRNETGMVYEA